MNLKEPNRNHPREASHEALLHWLALEHEGEVVEAEAWLSQAFLALDSEAPAAGLADRVLFQAFGKKTGLLERLGRFVEASLAARFVTGALATSVVLGALLMPALLVALSGAIGRQLAPGWTTELLIAGAGWVGAGASWMQNVSTMLGALDTLRADPLVVFLGWLALGASSMAFLGLRGVLESQRRKQYADV